MTKTKYNECQHATNDIKNNITPLSGHPLRKLLSVLHVEQQEKLGTSETSPPETGRDNYD